MVVFCRQVFSGLNPVRRSIVDAAFIFCLPRLRLPKLRFAWQASLFQLLIALFLNYLLFGSWTVCLLAFYAEILNTHEAVVGIVVSFAWDIR